MEVVYVKEENVSTKDETVVEDEQFLESNSISKTEHQNNEKSKALTLEETRGLLELIELRPVITSKETNATNNQQKVLVWKQIADEFNAKSGVCPRTPRQLRLKWENLKKNARRRNSNIRSNRGKTDLVEYIPRDAILDRVSTLMRRRSGISGQNKNGSKSSLSHFKNGGDQDDNSDSDDSDEEALAVVHERTHSSRMPFATERKPVFDEVAVEFEGFEGGTPDPSAADAEAMSPRSSNSRLPGSLMPLRKKKMKPDEGREDRNRAIATYYAAKTKVVEAKLTNLNLQNEKLKLEIEELKKKK